MLALVALSATAAAAAGRLVAIRPAGDAEASVIELVGDRPLSFTTLRLASPPRVVVDVADADPSGVAAAQMIDDGTVRRVAVALVGTTARVVIELAGETEFNVGAVGTVVQVRVSRLAPLVAKAAPRQVPPPAARPDGPPAPVAEPPPERRVALAPVQEVSPRAATPPPPALPAPAPAATPAPAEQRPAAPIAIAAAPTIVVPPAPAGAPAGPPQSAPVRAEPPPAEPPLAAPEPQARAEKPPPPQAPPSPEPAAAPRATPPAVVAQTSPPVANPPSAPAIAAERPRDIAAKRPPAPPKPPPQAIARAEPAAAPKPPPERRVARAERPASREAEHTASREDVERARASIPTVSIVASPPPAAAAPPPATAPARPLQARTRASITGIGFRPSAGGMVMVRSDRPLDYAVTGEGRVVVVHLRGAGIPLPTNRLPLDTRFFDTPVLRVVPEPVAGGIDLRIELRGQTRYELSQSSGLLTIAFERS